MNNLESLQSNILEAMRKELVGMHLGKVVSAKYDYDCTVESVDYIDSLDVTCTMRCIGKYLIFKKAFRFKANCDHFFYPDHDTAATYYKFAKQIGDMRKLAKNNK